MKKFKIKIMYLEPKHIVSSYTPNNIGKNIYDTVIKFKPKKIIDFGLLYGYSTVCLAQAVRDNGFGEIIGYDLFEEYPYKSSDKNVVENNLKYYNLEQYVTLKKMDFNTWINNPEDFDLLHIDISNNGDIIEKLYKACYKQINTGSIILFEGGSIERDNIEWMKKYNKTPINNIKFYTNYTLLTDKFPSLSIIKNNA